MRIIRYAAIAAVSLTAAPVAASTLPPIALLNATGHVTLDSSGLATTGVLDARYRQPPLGSRPYVFSTSLKLGPLTLTPSLTVTTPEVVISPGTPPTTQCLPIVGCVTIPGIPAITLDSQSLTITPSVPLASQGTVYDESIQSPPLPLGDIFAFDYGTPLFGSPLSFGQLVQDQFETGATEVNVAGALGPFGATFDYDGVLQPGGEQILADYAATLTGPGILGQVESFALGLINDNANLFAGLAYGLFLDTNPCGGFGPLQGACNDLLAGLDPDLFGLTVNSFGTLKAGYVVEKSIAPIPLPAAGWLMLAGLGGLAALRRRRTAA